MPVANLLGSRRHSHPTATSGLKMLSSTRLWPGWTRIQRHRGKYEIDIYAQAIETRRRRDVAGMARTEDTPDGGAHEWLCPAVGHQLVRRHAIVFGRRTQDAADRDPAWHGQKLPTERREGRRNETADGQRDDNEDVGDVLDVAPPTPLCGPRGADYRPPMRCWSDRTAARGRARPETRSSASSSRP
jgi:hypothetical protein